MNSLLEKYPEKTCFVIKDNEVIFSSTEKGVKPLMDYYNTYGITNGEVEVVDRIMGKGAVLLALLCKATVIDTPIISKEAHKLAIKYQLSIEYGKEVDYIINRSGDGQCPIEACLLGIDDIEEGYEMIKTTLSKLRAQT